MADVYIMDVRVRPRARDVHIHKPRHDKEEGQARQGLPFFCCV
jgi:hypothetical protein